MAAPQESPDQGAYVPTPRTVPTRSRDRASYDRETVHAILDEGTVCHLGFVRDGAPVVLPTLYTRIGEHLYVHGSTGSRPLHSARGEAGLPVCVTVTHLDALVLARSAFHHSLNYRSVVAHGTAHQVTDPAEKAAALDALVEVRLARQEVLRSERPLELSAVIDESVLHRTIGGPEVMRGQLAALREAAALPHVVLQVLPYTSGEHIGLTGPFVIFSFPNTNDLDLVVLDHLTSSLYLERKEDLSAYADAFASLQARALSAEDSLLLLAERHDDGP